MEISLLGPPQASIAGRSVALGPRKQQLLLALLALEVNAHIRIDRLIELMWPIEPPPTAKGMIHTYVSNLRKLLSSVGARNDGVWLERQEAGYRLRCDPTRIDVHRFDLLVAAARQCTDDEGRVAKLGDALLLWRGPALAGVATDEVRDRLFPRLEEVRITAVEDRVEALLRLRQYDGLLDELFSLTAQHPMRPRLVGALMRELHRAGRTANALEVYRSLRQRMRDELGLDPPVSLHDLQLAVLRNDPALAVDRAPTALRQLPAPIRHFVGRAAELKELRRLASLAGEGRSAGSTICAVIGPAGVGKTTLAVHLAHDVRDQFPDGQLYVNLRGFDPSASPVKPAEVLEDFLVALGVPAARVPHGLDAQTALYRSLLADKKTLVLADNAADAEQVRPLLPGSTTCFALVTSRNNLAGLLATESATPLVLDVLTATEAHQLLAGRLTDNRIRAARAAVDEIIVQCAHLPLALAIVGARAALQPHLPLTAIAEELRGHRRELDAFSIGDPAADLRAAFSCSSRQLTLAAARLFRLLALHPGPEFSALAAASLAGLTPHDVRPLLSELAHAYLITEPHPDRYTFHDLLRAYAREQIHSHESETDRNTAQQLVLDWYLQSAYNAAEVLTPVSTRLARPPAIPTTQPSTFDDNHKALRWFEAERTNLVAAVQCAANSCHPAVAWHLADAMHLFCQKHGHPSEWITASKVGLQAAQREQDAAGQAAMHYGLGSAHHYRQDFTAAETHLLQAIAMSRELKHSERQAAIINVVAMLYSDTGRLDKAEDYLHEGLAITQQLGDRWRQAIALCNLGNLYARLGQLLKSLDYMQRALGLAQEVGNRYGTAIYLGNVADTYLELGRYDDARHYATQSLGLACNLKASLTEAYAHIALADINTSIGEHQQAIANANAALAITRQVGNRRVECEALIALGRAHIAHDSAQAETVLAEAQRIADSFDFPHGQAKAAIARTHACAALGRHDEAQMHGDLALRKAADAGHRVLEGQALTALAQAHHGAGNHQLALTLANRAVENHRQTGHQPGLTQTVATLDNLR